MGRVQVLLAVIALLIALHHVVEAKHNCSGHRCHQGVCISTDVHYYCDCYPGWTGQHCTELIGVAPSYTYAPPTTLAPQPPPTTTSTTPSTTTTRPTTTAAPTTTASPTTPVPTTTVTPSPATHAPTTTQSTTVPTTTHAVQIHGVSCEKLGTVTHLANQVQVANQSAVTCPSGSHTSPEAFVLNNCPLALPGFWKQGDHVMSNCGSLQAYTPIAEFGFNGYDSSPSTVSGVFLGCEGTPLGFKIGVQECDGVPKIIHIDAGGSIDPNHFFAIKY